MKSYDASSVFCFSRKAFEASLRWRLHRSLLALEISTVTANGPFIDESFDGNLMGIQPESIREIHLDLTGNF